MKDISVANLLKDLTISDSETLTGGRPITIRVTANAKARFDRAQLRTGKRFGKKVREILMQLLDAVEASEKISA